MDTRIEPIELTDDELKAVAGGGLTISNSTFASVGGNSTVTSAGGAAALSLSFNNSFN